MLEEPVTLPTATTSEAEQHAEEFQCPVCAYTAVDAVSNMTCGHVLCEWCADDCTANKYTKCPHAGCGLPFRRMEIKPAYHRLNSKKHELGLLTARLIVCFDGKEENREVRARELIYQNALY